MAEDIAIQLGEKETADYIIGVMIESHLVAGALSFTSIPQSPSPLTPTNTTATR